MNPETAGGIDKLKCFQHTHALQAISLKTAVQKQFGQAFYPTFSTQTGRGQHEKDSLLHRIGSFSFGGASRA
jgi:hypothetical protein